MNRFVFADAIACIGCRSCEIACVRSHNQETYPERTDFRPRIHVYRNADMFAPLLCRQCEDAPCVASCPTGALSRKNDMIHLRDEDCIGCRNCILACPSGVIDMSDGGDNSKPHAYKCDLCASRTGPEAQACVKACPTEALHLMDDARLAALIRKRRRASVTGAPGPSRRVRGREFLERCGPRQDPPKLPAEVRKTNFQEIYIDLSKRRVEDQGKRCLQCSDHPICEWTCPLHNAIPGWIKLAREGRIIEAAELSHQTSSLPEICGRVCPQNRLCEGSCTLNHHPGAVTIGMIEQYVTDTALAMGWRPDVSAVRPMGRRVAIIGAGPAGLGCADILARNGVEAHVFDRNPEIGGLLTFGIPPFKLDKGVLERRREIFTQMGITFHLNCEVGRDISLKDLANDYDAVFLGVGTYEPITSGVANEDAPGVLKALPYLAANTRHVMGLREDPRAPYVSMEGKRVVVIGGGDTAMDCLLTAVRQGASSAICAYRRDEANMPGSKKEVKNAREEGAEFQFNVQPLEFELGTNGEIAGLKLIRTEMGQVDRGGRRVAKPVAGSEFTLPVDVIITAFGFKPHAMPWLEECGVRINSKGLIVTNAMTYPGQTTNPLMFGGGDAIRGADLVVTALDDGRKAALNIIRVLEEAPAPTNAN